MAHHLHGFVKVPWSHLMIKDSSADADKSSESPLSYPAVTPDANHAPQPPPPQAPYKPYRKDSAQPDAPYEPYKGM